jgi:hypothetical protein
VTEEEADENVYGEEEDDAMHYETPLQLAEDLVREGAEDDTVSDDLGTRRMHIAGLLRDAGGVTHTQSIAPA